MGRASTRTLLPLDRWAYILGLEPRHFNGVFSALAPVHACRQPWLQHDWQAADRVGREGVAQAIAQAEADITLALGYNLLPDWSDGEVIRTAQPLDPSSILYGLNQNTRGLYQSVKTRWGKVISGGMQAKALIGLATIAGFTMTWTDLDGDGYDEYAEIILPTTATDINEIRAYFAGEDGDDVWEIRPLRKVTITGGNVIIDIDRHLLVDPDLWEAIDSSGVDGDVDANFVASVEIYRVYNDPSQQVQMQWERTPGTCECGSASCAICAWAVQWGCLQTRDPRLGFVTYVPANWDPDTEQYALASQAVSRQPERVRLWYYSGHYNPKIARPYCNMDPLMERIITYYSVTLLDRPVCACDNVETFIQRWREDKSFVSSSPSSSSKFQISNRDLGCPWGTLEGAIWAWRQVQDLAIGRGVQY